MNFARPTEIKRMTIRERCLLTDILYGTPDLSLLPLFAPSFDYPIGFRFNTAALFTVLSMFDCEKLIRGCNARKSGTYFNFNSMYSLTIASGNSTDYNDRTVSGS
uniref:Uncharacterized protein n=1 Tax=Elaeophora elaphi TaxID=1147741 RepID=A0A0R3RKC2_9BILA